MHGGTRGREACQQYDHTGISRSCSTRFCSAWKALVAIKSEADTSLKCRKSSPGCPVVYVVMVLVKPFGNVIVQCLILAQPKSK